jgi:ATP-dependent RNA helicase RhlB
VFTRTKHGADRVVRELRKADISARAIHGDKSQNARQEALDQFKKGHVAVLIATDIAARGIDIVGLSHVINYDLPNEPENYVHRIGRTARAGKTGKAITFASEQDVYQLPRIERYIGRKIPSETSTGELLSEDKSEGKRIHADFPDEQGNVKARSRSKASPQQKEALPGKREKRKGHETRKGQGRKKPGILPNADLGSAELSSLSLEERMIYYRQKYEKSSGVQGPRKERGHSDSASSLAAPERPGKSSPPAQKREKTGSRKERYRKHGKKKREAAAIAPDQEVAAEIHSEENAEKKGFLTKLLGFFKKEK